MASKVLRNITITKKNGDVIELKKVDNDKWGITQGGTFFYVEYPPEVAHDGNDYFEEVAKSHWYPVGDIEKIDSDIITRVEGRREIFEHKRGEK